MSEQFGQEKAAALQALPSGTVLTLAHHRQGLGSVGISQQTSFLLWEGRKAKTCYSAKKSRCF